MNIRHEVWIQEKGNVSSYCICIQRKIWGSDHRATTARFVADGAGRTADISILYEVLSCEGIYDHRCDRD